MRDKKSADSPRVRGSTPVWDKFFADFFSLIHFWQIWQNDLFTGKLEWAWHEKLRLKITHSSINSTKSVQLAMEFSRILPWWIRQCWQHDSTGLYGYKCCASRDAALFRGSSRPPAYMCYWTREESIPGQTIDPEVTVSCFIHRKGSKLTRMHSSIMRTAHT